ncbi:SDR family NAD(P)-dependent oxidoreductase [Paenibacillus alginolyticus]|uniref:SDR family oxidoreductase n=1 Tax=Paenibacillus alginolyticus TaxID=59839 RepID=A0ABT4GHL2_9BACL|nr:SDR family NAD(P)-dependent oxidoreductase [Paenibacillus alginolyticus]MCY9695665.1 SDR family oxidoreductase [Paenibacillus alginolyticus]MEC0142203.1 SDR family NAD(P)-dependent oxidoreductase [Paenibacillus alginolyticus]
MRLQGKRALITGGARGIGQGIADKFVQEGASVVLLDFRADQLEVSADTIRRHALERGQTAQVATVVCDLSVPEQVDKAVQTAWSCWDGIDILVNNAGIATREPFVDIPLSRWQQVININLNATFQLSQWVAKQMIANAVQGSIVNMASKNGLAGSAVLAHYNASKGGVVLLTQSMAVDLAGNGIRVNAVAPGFIDTPLDRELKEKSEGTLALTERTPMRRLGTIEEVATAFLFLASDEASYITGTTLVVDGGHLANACDL